MTATLRELIALHYGDGVYDAGLSALRERLASGEYVTAIAREIKDHVTRAGLKGVACSRPALSKLLNADDEGRELTRQAREEGGHALFEKALQAVEDLPLDATKDAAAVARLKFEATKWGAAKLNKAYDDKAEGVTVQVAAGSLFLQAVSKPNALPPSKPAPKELPPVDADVVEEEPDD